ncbi:MAG: SseB family protein [Lachnospiraceae bacterium]|nr:SseB family protein [Lachnospiraceae bacterium]
MEFNKNVSNPMLVGAIELMKAEDTPEHRSMFVDELVKAEFLSPAMIDPAPEEDGEGQPKIAQGSKVQLPMLSASDGTKFFMAFTDSAEYDKWQERNQKMYTFALKVDEYAGMILRREPNGNLCPALGMVINPYGANIILPREMLASMMSAKIAQAQQMAAAAKQAGQYVVPGAAPEGKV